MTDIEKAKQLLGQGDCTVAICRGELVYKRTERGVAPVLSLIEQGADLCGASAADKVIGKAAAMLLVMAGVTEIYGAVMSRMAAEFLASRGVRYSFGELTERIRNRSGDGFCPMELAVMDIDDPAMALTAIKNRLDELRKDGR
ncbi:MAG: DUF1893 domain-containing protein [Ruminococcaceae bacterium]|nr:DUF1893 domain-containing protein [Oscillospiraceae bacterium]